MGYLISETTNFLHQQMPIISSQYWNMVHGQKAEVFRLDSSDNSARV
jgi:hypothetical protein